MTQSYNFFPISTHAASKKVKNEGTCTFDVKVSILFPYAIENVINLVFASLFIQCLWYHKNFA